ncbi:MAG: aldo/keto reductase [Polyangiaceae bacterium]|nr:aldo/keto reductase [Polyangiaceae bacterium]
MRVRTLGKTGLRVSELGLGTWGLSGDGYGHVEPEEQERVVQRSIEMGFTLLETADAYGAGRMEQLIGRVTRGNDDVVIVTKGGTDRSTAPARKRFDGEYLRESVERSLRRLGRDRIDVYLLHGPPAAAVASSDGDAIAAMLALKAEGKIAHWGISTGDLTAGRAALRAGAEVIELAYNLVHPSDLHRLAGEIIVAGAGVLARSTLAYGLLSGGWSRDREFGAGDHRAQRWSKIDLAWRVEQVKALRFLLSRDVPTLAAAAVRFVLSNSIVSSAVLGPRSVEQIEDLVRGVGMGPVYLRDAELARLPRALEAVGIES